MKKIFFVLALFSVLLASSQKNKWSISVFATMGIGGPQNSIVKTMKEQGFGETMHFNFLGLQGDVDNPNAERSGTYLLRCALRQKVSRSLFFVAGISNQGTVSGYHHEGTDPIFGFDMGSFPRVKYRVFQFTGGYQYDLKNSSAKFGVGPSVLLFNYGLEMTSNDKRKTSIVPGATFNFQLPLGKGKKSFGVELIAEGSVAPQAKMKQMQETTTSTPLKESRVNMIHANAGLLFTFRG